MDAERFDTLTRSLTAPRSRRGALAMLLGGTLGLLGGRLPEHGAMPVRAAQGTGLADALVRGDQPLVSCAALGLTNCGGLCVDLQSDAANCGGCGVFCSGGLCSGGYCVGIWDDVRFSCAASGLNDCGGTCADIYSDPYNCGGCGYTCGAGQICAGAACVWSAPSGLEFNVCASQGLTDCGGYCADLASDTGHCGFCFNSCPLGAYCQDGACVG
jgi:hypothetical protein